MDAVRCGSLSAKETLIIGLFGGKWPIKIRHSMHLDHPVTNPTTGPKEELNQLTKPKMYPRD